MVDNRVMEGDRIDGRVQFLVAIGLELTLSLTSMQLIDLFYESSRLLCALLIANRCCQESCEVEGCVNAR